MFQKLQLNFVSKITNARMETNIQIFANISYLSCKRLLKIGIVFTKQDTMT
jgi:hypothetical protein